MRDSTRHGKRMVTTYGLRNWNRIVDLAKSRPEDVGDKVRLADALAGLMAEILPVQREVLAPKFMASSGVIGRLGSYPLPPGISEGIEAQRRWATTLVLDCLDHLSDTVSAATTLDERLDWRAAALAYTESPVDLGPGSR